MPELPDVVVYLERLAAKTKGATLDGIRFASPFVLRSFDPKPAEVLGKPGQVRLVSGPEGDKLVIESLNP